MTHLRQMLLDELQRRNYSQSTVRSYIHVIEDFSKHCHRSPDRLGPDHIRQYQAHLFRDRRLLAGTITSYTLCHEFCHHLDFKKFGFVDSWRTRGFYEMAGVLYHHARGTPLKKLFWVPVAGGRWRIDWQRTNRGA